MTTLLEAIWSRALEALETEARRHGHSVGEADRHMVTADSGDLLDWACDLEARLGYAVADFRAELIDYCIVRDGPGCPAEADHIASLRAAHAAAASQG